MSEKLYQQQAPQGDAAAQQPGGDTGAQGGQYYDADYKVVVMMTTRISKHPAPRSAA